jgi:hypothetical protein
MNTQTDTLVHDTPLKWRSRLQDYVPADCLGLKFETKVDRDAFLHVCRSPESPLYGVPKHYPGFNTVVVPREAATLAKHTGLRFSTVKVRHPDELSAQEYTRLRSEQGLG